MLRRVFHGSLGSVNWQSLGIGSPGFENAVLSRLMHSITTSFSRSAIASNGSLEFARGFFLASVLDHSTALDNALAACCLETSGSSSGVGGGGGLGTEEFVFDSGWSAGSVRLSPCPRQPWPRLGRVHACHAARHAQDTQAASGPHCRTT